MVSLLAAALLLVGACGDGDDGARCSEGANCLVERELGCGEPAPHTGCHRQLQASACEAAGGTIRYWNDSPSDETTYCSCPTTDAGCSCTSSDDCQGVCYADFPACSATAGQCSDTLIAEAPCGCVLQPDGGVFEYCY